MTHEEFLQFCARSAEGSQLGQSELTAMADHSSVCDEQICVEWDELLWAQSVDLELL